jgi:lysozyme family protein
MTTIEQDRAFNAAFRELIGEEGGYVFNPADPGGETKFGITKRTYPALNIKDLDLGTAKAIYYRDFWLPLGDQASLPVRTRYFSFSGDPRVCQ